MRNALMTVNTSTLHGVPLVVLAGEIGHESCPELRRTLEGILSEGIDRLLLDFSKVEHIDSGCIGLMWALFRSVEGHGWMGVIGANANILRILSNVGLVEDGTLRFFETPEDAALALVT